MKYKKNSKVKLTNVKLYRVVNNKVRYYSIKIYQTLFFTYQLERKFGSTKNKNPTGVIKNYYDELDEAIVALKFIARTKLKKGYRYG